MSTYICKIAGLMAFLSMTSAAAQSALLTPEQRDFGAQRIAKAKAECGKAYPFTDNDDEAIYYAAKYSVKDWQDTIATCKEEDAKKSGRQVAEIKPEETPAKSKPNCDSGTWSDEKGKCTDVKPNF